MTQLQNFKKFVANSIEFYLSSLCDHTIFLYRTLVRLHSKIPFKLSSFVHSQTNIGPFLDNLHKK